MLTTFDQVREWITDNGLKRWMLFKDYSCKEKFLDSAAFPGDQADKIAMTEKYLRSVANGNAYAKGGVSAGKDDMDMVAEIRLETQGTRGVGSTDAINIGELRDSITREIRATIELENLKKREADVARREKELDADRQSAMGALIHYFAPIGQQLIQRGMMRNVAGVDSEEPVHVQTIHVDQPEEKTKEVETEEVETEEVETQEQEQNPFTDEEADELFDLMARFKKVESNWLKMIRKVVVMAETNDPMYGVAQNYLAK